MVLVKLPSLLHVIESVHLDPKPLNNIGPPNFS